MSEEISTKVVNYVSDDTDEPYIEIIDINSYISIPFSSLYPICMRTLTIPNNPS